MLNSKQLILNLTKIKMSEVPNQNKEATTENVDTLQQPLSPDMERSFKNATKQVNDSYHKDGGDKERLKQLDEKLENIEGNDKNEQTFNELKEWRENWKAKDIISDAELKDKIGLYKVRPDKIIERFEKKVKLAKLLIAAKERGMETITRPYVMDRETSNKYSTTGLKWSHREKTYIEDKSHVVSGDAPDIEYGSSVESSSRKSSFEKTAFTNQGKEKTMEFFSKKFGKNAKKAYEYNMNLLRNEVSKYLNGQLSAEDFRKQLELNNKTFGAEIFDIEALLKLEKPKIINSGNELDTDAW